MAFLSVNYQIMIGYRYPLPIVNLALIGPLGRIPVRAEIDSGADFSIFPDKAATDVGIPLGNAARIPIHYGGSTVIGRRLRASILLGELRLNPPVVFVPVLKFPYALLGRVGIFSQFKEVAFLEKEPTKRVEFRSIGTWRHR